MKRLLYILCTGLLISMLTACSIESENDETIQLANTETEKVVVKSNGSYVTGDFLIEVETDYEKGSDFGDVSQFFFGGFIVDGVNGSFVINEFINRSSNAAKSSSYYYRLNKNKVIKLPRSNISLKVVEYDIANDTIEFELIDESK